VGAAYAGTLALLGEVDESSAAVKEFLQSVGVEVAGILEEAIGESLAQISHLKTRGAELEGKIADLKREVVRSDYDVLTHALSRRGFLTRAERFLELAREYETPCAAGFVDVDDFKGLNDRLGNAGGDAALVLIAERLVEHFRGRGIVGRVGADEFAFLLLAKSHEEVEAEGRRLNAALAGMRVGEGAAAVAVSASVGVAWVGVPALGQTVEMTLRAADEAMCGARRGGRAAGGAAMAG
jgi:diguanylate cyclase (GGDEF)-like protein